MRNLNKKLALPLGGSALLITSFGVPAQGAGQAPEPKVWKIGLEGPLTGSQSDIGIGMLKGAQLAAQEINAAGGVLGRQVEIIPIDDAADPTVGVAAANEAIRAGLDGVVGPYNSGVGLRRCRSTSRTSWSRSGSRRRPRPRATASRSSP